MRESLSWGQIRGRWRGVGLVRSVASRCLLFVCGRIQGRESGMSKAYSLKAEPFS